MSDQIVVAIIVALSTLAGVLMTLYFEGRRRKSEDKRWFAEHYLGKKIEALMNLYSAIYNSNEALNRYGNFSPKTDTEYRAEVESKVDEFLSCFHFASVYLDQENEKAIRKCIEAFIEASQAIYSNLPDKELQKSFVNVKDSYPAQMRSVDFPGLSESYISAVKILKQELWPKAVQEYSTFNKRQE